MHVGGGGGGDRNGRTNKGKKKKTTGRRVFENGSGSKSVVAGRIYYFFHTSRFPDWLAILRLFSSSLSHTHTHRMITRSTHDGGGRFSPPPKIGIERKEINFFFYCEKYNLKYVCFILKYVGFIIPRVVQTHYGYRKS